MVGFEKRKHATVAYAAVVSDDREEREVGCERAQ